MGWIYVTKARLRKEFGIKRVTETVLKKAEKILRAEVKIYDQYLRGEIFGFSVYSLKDGMPVHKNSCGGFFGNSLSENGMIEYVPEEFVPLLKELSSLYGREILLLGKEERRVFSFPEEFREYAKSNSVFGKLLQVYSCFQELFAA